MMNKGTLFSLAFAFLWSPLAAQDVFNPLQELQALKAEVVEPLSLKTRAEAFPALGVLLADTDSFVAIGRLGELAQLCMAGTGDLPGVDFAMGLDSLAVGISARAVEDLQRMLPLFQVLSATDDEELEAWSLRATPEAARAIVAAQREQRMVDGSSLVQATKDFHLAPIYAAASVKPGSEELLQQLSMLPLMLPMGMETQVEMTVRSGWRGFCIHGDSLDLSRAELSPELESQLYANLQDARFYLLARVVGNKMVMVVCSHPDEVKLPAKYADSVLATPQAAAFDASLARKAWAVGHSSPAVVKMREELDLFDFQYVASFMERVFRNMAPGNEVCGVAAAAVKSLLDTATRMFPTCHGAERVSVWHEDSLYLHLVTGAGTQQFKPASLQDVGLARRADTVLYVESTPMAGLPMPEIPDLISNVLAVQKGYLATLRPEYAESEAGELRWLQEHRPILEPFVMGLQGWQRGLSGSATLVLTEPAPGSPAGVHFSLRGEIADAAALQHLQAMWQNACAGQGTDAPASLKVESDADTVLLSYGGACLGLESHSVGIPVQGGAVASLNMPALVRVLEKRAAEQKTEESALECENARVVADCIERVDAAICTEGDELHMLLRFQPAANE